MRIKITLVLLIGGLSGCHDSGSAFYIYNSKDHDFYVNGEVLEPKKCIELETPPDSISLSKEQNDGSIVCSSKAYHVPCEMREGMGYYTISFKFITAIYRLGGEKYELSSIPSGDTTCPPPKNPGFFT